MYVDMLKILIMLFRNLSSPSANSENVTINKDNIRYLFKSNYLIAQKYDELFLGINSHYNYLVLMSIFYSTLLKCSSVKLCNEINLMAKNSIKGDIKYKVVHIKQ